MKTILILFFVIIVEFLIESWVAGKYYKSKSVLYRVFKKRDFSFWRYLAFLGLPFITVMAVILSYDFSAIIIFILFSLIGTFLEWLIGFAYHRVAGKRLWTYDEFNISGYTSYLSVPLWGMLGVIFWFLVKIL